MITDEEFLIRLIPKKDNFRYIAIERDLMLDFDTKWLVKLYYAFEDIYYLYIIMEYCIGGDLNQLLLHYGN